MIVVTVGSMLPFERMIRSMDQWSGDNPHVDVFAQIGNGEYEPRHMKWVRKIAGNEYKKKISEASLVVAHAGIGSIFTAFEFHKRLLLVPRYADKKEHTTDHQLHTANYWRNKPNIVVVERNDVFGDKLQEALDMKIVENGFSPVAPDVFVEKIRNALMG